MRFGRKMRQLPEPEAQRPDRPRAPALCPDFLIETYLDHQGEQFCLKYDANSLIYISKAMDLFDMTEPALRELGLIPSSPSPSSSTSTEYTVRTKTHSRSHPPPTNPPPYLPELAAGLKPLAHIPSSPQANSVAL